MNMNKFVPAKHFLNQIVSFMVEPTKFIGVKRGEIP